MVARIRTGKNIVRVLQYNEQKVQQGKAELLQAENFFKEATQLGFTDKRKLLEKYTSLNEVTETNALHISLNFDLSEYLEKAKLIEIAQAYMEGIGFGDQPYLVYGHEDAGHPHIHIVTTNIQADGSRISTHNLGRNQSETTRKKIEEVFDLVKAERTAISHKTDLSISARKISYGKGSTKRAISNVLGVVIDQYRYHSLEQLNAVLSLYNVMADRGAEGTTMQEKRGLIYQVLDERGRKISAPIKASAFYMKPTLANLEPKMLKNEKLKAPGIQRIKAEIDFAFLKSKQLSIERMIAQLQRARIHTVIHQTRDGFIYGFTFIDHHTKCVCNGSELGNQYSAKILLQRCDLPAPRETILPHITNSQKSTAWTQEQMNHQDIRERNFLCLPEQGINTLPADDIPFPLKRNKRKKKKRKLNL